MTRYIFITGGVVSSLGKGLASASLAALLQARGYSVRLRKLDPYLNVDPGTMSPYQHGEVYVTEDGAETDLDLGHYERFTGVPALRGDNITTGKIYSKVIAKERKGEYLGRTVQVIPHITDLIKDFVLADTGDTDFILCEIGGTVGDIEGLPFFESIRQLGNDLGPNRAIYIHLTLLPYVAVARELKTKPTQHSVKELRSIGIQPNILLCRADRIIPQNELKKIALFCNIPEDRVIPAIDQKNLYRVPLAYHEEKLDVKVLEYFGMDYSAKPDLTKWHKIADTIENPEKEIIIAIAGKYNTLRDAYKSLIEAFVHAGIHHKCKVKLRWVSATNLKPETIREKMQGVSGIMVPGGFGSRGVEGKIQAIKYARENNIPFFGICFGMQLALIEAARHILGIADAGSTEFNEPCSNIIDLMSAWDLDGKIEARTKENDLGGSMRLGSYPCTILKQSLAYDIYGAENIKERHRHRYEFNVNFKQALENAGIVFSGLSPDKKLAEIIELPSHPWFVGVQFHPELKSQPFKPHPLFISFVAAAIKLNILT